MLYHFSYDVAFGTSAYQNPLFIGNNILNGATLFFPWTNAWLLQVFLRKLKRQSRWNFETQCNIWTRNVVVGCVFIMKGFIWLVVWLPFFIFPEIWGISSSQLTNSYFSEGWPWPTKQLCTNQLKWVSSRLAMASPAIICWGHFGLWEWVGEPGFGPSFAV